MQNNPPYIINLDFASLYQCAIKPLKRKSQKNTVSIILEGLTGISVPVADSCCSQYCTGRRAIPENTKNNFILISMEEFKKRMDAIGINDFEPIAAILKSFVSIANIPDTEKEKLLTLEKNLSYEEFTKEVFVQAISAPVRGKPFTPEELSFLSNLKKNCEQNNYSSTGNSQQSHHFDLSGEKMDWLRQYIAPHIHINLHSLNTSASIQHYCFQFPEDFAALIYLIEPALTGRPLDTFNYETFIECTGIHPSTGVLTKGQLECWKFSGSVHHIAKAIKRLNFSDVSDIVFLMEGSFTFSEIEELENTIKKTANSQIGFLHALCHNNSSENINVTLIVRIFPEKAKRQKEQEQNADNIDKDVIKYTLRRRNI